MVELGQAIVVISLGYGLGRMLFWLLGLAAYIQK